MKEDFVTTGRATLAYLVGITVGAAAFMPLLEVIASLRGAAPVPVSARYDTPFFWLRAELGAIIAAFIAPAAPLFPFFVAAMAFAKWRRIDHWFYYIAVGIFLTILLSLFLLRTDGAATNFQSQLVARFIVEMAMPTGALFGYASWAFLRATQRTTAGSQH
ncbi:MAG: hypothetical protein PCALPYG88_7165 [uncultured Paraburkholderia sp.]|uniref:hypothetical protein n=1 Tax=uncultured Paraburkholderia sp. TaxID=1822466 RepID=UPI002599A511|nr:hypothetical protein [uncultured Paraburkholderia sp.]CAH2904104.1 MAG: hypothetical protein PCALPYG08_7208 [uncultured Paraburkholderia sp.]CAH2942284.1 MAG: hypothetical protein PCALPYG88_7165 [uncultured Paraburkholderia sp.]